MTDFSSALSSLDARVKHSRKTCSVKHRTSSNFTLRSPIVYVSRNTSDG